VTLGWVISLVRYMPNEDRTGTGAELAHVVMRTAPLRRSDYATQSGISSSALNRRRAVMNGTDTIHGNWTEYMFR
jgi:hypothetical protein